MHTFVTSAIVGTGQQCPETLTTGTPVDGLVERLPADNIERNVLLAAGAWSVYRQAGYSAQRLAGEPGIAPDESILACSARVADLIEKMQKEENANLLLEALERLHKAGQRLPYTLLPEMLNYGSKKKEIRAALIPVLGERGCWLSRYNSQWSWVAQFLNKHCDTLPTDAESIWQEGTLGQRTVILRLQRVADASLAREWLTDVWKKERAEARQELLNTFDTELSAEDEAFLEIARNDRSEHVQRIARSLLVRIPTSALTRRLVTQVDTMISYSLEKSIFSKKTKLIVHIPATVDPEWERLNLEEKPAWVQTSDERWHLQQVIALVAPQHWEERFAASVDDLLAATHDQDEQLLLVKAWTDAALLHNAQHWYVPLCKWWLNLRANNRSYTSRDRQAIMPQLLQHMALSEAEDIILPLLGSDVNNWASLFLSLPTPCSHEFGLRSLNALKRYVDVHKNDPYYDYNWARVLPHMAKVLPPTCLERASTLWQLSDLDTWANQQLYTMLTLFTKQIELRKNLLEELG